MAPNPFECEAILCIALLVAFCGMLPAILSLAVPEWIVVDESEAMRLNFQKDQSTSDEISTENRAVPTTSVVNLVIQNSTQNSTTDDYLDVNSSFDNATEKTLVRLMPVPRHTPTENSEELYEQTLLKNLLGRNLTDLTMGRRTLIADFDKICLINAAGHSCHPLSLFTNLSSVCKQENVSEMATGDKTRSNGILCDAFFLSKGIEELGNAAKLSPILAVAFAIASTVVVDILAVLNSGENKLKLVVGTIFAGTGVTQIVNVFLLHDNVVNGFPPFEKSRVTLGIAGHLSYINGALNIITAILLFLPSPNMSSNASPTSESTFEIPFENLGDESGKELKQRHSSTVGILSADGVESEEWGYSPMVVDTKEVRFEIVPLSDYENEIHPRFSMYTKELKLNMRRSDDDQPGTSSVESSSFEKIYEIEDENLITTAETNKKVQRPNLDTATENVTRNQSDHVKHAQEKVNNLPLPLKRIKTVQDRSVRENESVNLLNLESRTSLINASYQMIGDPEPIFSDSLTAMSNGMAMRILTDDEVKLVPNDSEATTTKSPIKEFISINSDSDCISNAAENHSIIKADIHLEPAFYDDRVKLVPNSEESSMNPLDIEEFASVTSDSGGITKIEEIQPGAAVGIQLEIDSFDELTRLLPHHSERPIAKPTITEEFTSVTPSAVVTGTAEEIQRNSEKGVQLKVDSSDDQMELVPDHSEEPITKPIIFEEFTSVISDSAGITNAEEYDPDITTEVHLETEYFDHHVEFIPEHSEEPITDSHIIEKFTSVPSNSVGIVYADKIHPEVATDAQLMVDSSNEQMELVADHSEDSITKPLFIEESTSFTSDSVGIANAEENHSSITTNVQLEFGSVRGEADLSESDIMLHNGRNRNSQTSHVYAESTAEDKLLVGFGTQDEEHGEEEHFPQTQPNNNDGDQTTTETANIDHDGSEFAAVASLENSIKDT